MPLYSPLWKRTKRGFLITLGVGFLLGSLILVSAFDVNSGQAFCRYVEEEGAFYHIWLNDERCRFTAENLKNIGAFYMIATGLCLCVFVVGVLSDIVYVRKQQKLAAKRNSPPKK